MKKAAVGPVDVSALLADIRSGKVAPRTSSVTICVSPDVADRADDLADRINALIGEIEQAEGAERGVADPGPTEKLAELEALQAEHNALLAEYEHTRVTFTFRSQNETDAVQVRAAVAEIEGDPSPDEVTVIGTAQYCVEPKLTPQDVRDLIRVIGWQQYTQLVECWQVLVFGKPSAPKSLRPSRGPVTGKL